MSEYERNNGLYEDDDEDEKEGKRKGGGVGGAGVSGASAAHQHGTIFGKSEEVKFTPNTNAAQYYQNGGGYSYAGRTENTAPYRNETAVQSHSNEAANHGCRISRTVKYNDGEIYTGTDRRVLFRDMFDAKRDLKTKSANGVYRKTDGVTQYVYQFDGDVITNTDSRERHVEFASNLRNQILNYGRADTPEKREEFTNMVNYYYEISERWINRSKVIEKEITRNEIFYTQTYTQKYAVKASPKESGAVDFPPLFPNKDEKAYFEKNGVKYQSDIKYNENMDIIKSAYNDKKYDFQHKGKTKEEYRKESREAFWKYSVPLGAVTVPLLVTGFIVNPAVTAFLFLGVQACIGIGMVVKYVADNIKYKNAAKKKIKEQYKDKIQEHKKNIEKTKQKIKQLNKEKKEKLKQAKTKEEKEKIKKEYEEKVKIQKDAIAEEKQKLKAINKEIKEKIKEIPPRKKCENDPRVDNIKKDELKKAYKDIFENKEVRMPNGEKRMISQREFDMLEQAKKTKGSELSKVETERIKSEAQQLNREEYKRKSDEINKKYMTDGNMGAIIAEQNYNEKHGIKPQETKTEKHDGKQSKKVAKEKAADKTMTNQKSDIQKNTYTFKISTKVQNVFATLDDIKKGNIKKPKQPRPEEISESTRTRLKELAELSSSLSSRTTTPTRNSMQGERKKSAGMSK